MDKSIIQVVMYGLQILRVLGKPSGLAMFALAALSIEAVAQDKVDDLRPIGTVTLTEGAYPETFKNDTLRWVGNALFNTRLGRVVAVRDGVQVQRFGFQGQEKDDEMHGATGTSYAFEYRMHDARVGRFLSIDPLAAKYPHNSPYAFSENRVLDGIELEGLEWQPLDGDNNPVPADDGNIASYSWSGFDSQGAAPAGTVASANLRIGGNTMKRYTSNAADRSGLIQMATVSQENLTAIGQLDGRIQDDAKVLALRSELELGTPLRITQGLRTTDQQNRLYAQGRTRAQLDRVGLTDVQPVDGPIVTRARGGQSPHNFGMAFDVARVTDANHTDAYDLNWNALGTLGTSLGMDWGGNWTSIQDRPHFEVPNWREIVEAPMTLERFLLFPEE